MGTSEEKKAYNRDYYRKNKERLIEAQRQRYFKNIEKIKAQRKKFYDQNRDEILARQRERYYRDIEKSRARYRTWNKNRRFFERGITREEYEAMAVSQGGVCAICKRPCEIREVLSIDHHHETGAVRGLLCGRCNSGLGFFRDSHDLLIRAAEYLKRHLKAAA